MKKIILMTIGLIVLFFVFNTVNVQANDNNQTGTTTTTTTDGSGVSCYCGAVYGKGCKADNKGASCNPSGSSKCWEYDRNCS